MAEAAGEEAEALPVFAAREESGWPNETAEAAYWADARERGETRSTPADPDGESEGEAGAALPSLDGLVERVPAEVKAALDELFRARFVRVARIPRKAMKAARRS